MTIHARIKERRTALGLSMQALAQRVGLGSWQAVQSWERPNGAVPRHGVLPKLAEALGVSEQWLLFGDVPDAKELSPEALQWAAIYQRMSEAERRTFRAAMLLSAKAVPDELVNKVLPPEPAGKDKR